MTKTFSNAIHELRELFEELDWDCLKRDLIEDLMITLFATFWTLFLSLAFISIYYMIHDP
jgi:hypothetical protein